MPPDRRRPATRIPAAEVSGTAALTTLMAGVVVVGALYFGRAVLIPITLAVLLSFLIAPLVARLRALRLGQVFSVLSAVVVALAVILAVGTLIGTQVAQLAGDLPRYQATIENKLGAVRRVTVGRADTLLHRAANALKRIEPQPSQQPGGVAGVPSGAPSGAAAQNGDGPRSRARHGVAAASAVPAPQQPASAPMPVEVHQPEPTPLELAQRFLAPVIVPLETTFIVLVVAVFILIQREDLRDRMIRLFGARDLHRTTTALDEAARRLSRYFLAQLGVNSSVGLVIALGLAAIGVPGALLFGVLAALLRFVPYIGTWLAAAMAAIFAAAVEPGWSMMIWTIVLFGITDVVAAQVVEPILYGHSTGLSPFAVIMAAIFWSWIWGPIGLILSTPLTLCLVILGRHVERLEFLDVLFGDRPALTLSENFYQRLLAGDPDEALAQAEAQLADMSLTTYYNDVVLEGLRLAAHDIARGVVTDMQLQRIMQTATEVVEGLDDVDDVEPAREPDKRGELASPVEPSDVLPMGRVTPVSGGVRAAASAAAVDDAGRTGAATEHQPLQVGRGGAAASADQAAAPKGMAATADRALMAGASASSTDRTAPGARAEPSGSPAADAELGDVAVVAGRGALDEVAAVIVVQLLGKHGQPARLIIARDASRRPAESGVADAALVCIVSLDAPYSTTHLRFLAKRLRGYAPRKPLVFGVEGAMAERGVDIGPDGNVAQDATTLNVDFVARSLGSLIQACARLARAVGARADVSASVQYVEGNPCNVAVRTRAVD